MPSPQLAVPIPFRVDLFEVKCLTLDQVFDGGVWWERPSFKLLTRLAIFFGAPPSFSGADSVNAVFPSLPLH